MIWFLALLAAAAVLAPLFGADTRDGRDWRPSGPEPYGPGSDGFRTTGSPAPAAAARERAAAHRPASVAG
ncbi:hypothetical protein GCM10010466_05140 [Planomonospora alba]|uniref:Uncharacterized protein n=1 Tax=Planomonospora alba TaxID=161354 RepID=A0ABP6MJY1_9ACTN